MVQVETVAPAIAPEAERHETEPRWSAPAPAPTPVAPAPSRVTAPRPSLRTLLAGPLGVVLVALVAGLFATWYSASHDLLLLYGDARSHLTIARRLIDGPNAGIVQLGTVWLPLPHLLLVPFVESRWLWHTGLAAIPVGLACLAIEALSVYSIVGTVGGSRRARWIAVLVFVTNPSLLYLHTTALTEPVLFAAMLTTVATLARWATAEKAYSGGEIAVFCGLPATAAVLSRYDGWAFVVAAAAFVVFVAWRRWGSLRYALHVARCFVALPVIAGAWWMWFNWVNFGDPLEFQRGQYSAQAQQALLAAEGHLPEQHNLGVSLTTYSTSVLRGAGWLVVACALFGMVAWLWRRRFTVRTLAPWLLVAVPFGFYVASLYTGQAALRLDPTATDSMFNLRYGVEMLAGLAVFAGLGASVMLDRVDRLHRPWLGVVATGAIVVLVGAQAAAWWPDHDRVPVVEEGLAQRAAGAGQYAAAEWLREHARDDGLLLIDDSVNPVLPVINTNFDRVAAPFSGPRWHDALIDPSRATWVYVDVANPGDDVAAAIARDPWFRRDFDLVFAQGGAEVYRRRGNS